MVLRLRTEAQYSLIRINGNVSTLEECTQLQERFEKTLKSNPPRVVLDFSENSFISSNILSFVVNFLRNANTIGSKVIVVFPTSHPCYDLFEKVGFTKLMDFFPSLESFRLSLEHSTAS